MTLRISVVKVTLLAAIMMAAMIPMLPSPSFLTTAVGVTAHPPIVADATASELWPDTNYGTSTNMWVRSSSDASWKDARIFIKADLSSIPPGAKIVSATLSLYVWSPPSDSRTHQIYLLDQTWIETTITWNNRPLWPAQPTAVPEATVGTSAGWVSWDVKNQIQIMLHRSSADVWQNRGWEIKDKTEGSAGTNQHQVQFRTREYADASFRPKLEVVYYAPSLVLTPSASSFAAGTWVQMTVQRVDDDDNPITNGLLVVDLSSTSTSPNKKFAYTAGGAPVTSVTIPSGSSTRTFYYYDTKVGTWTVGASTDDYTNYYSDSDTITVNPGAPAALDLTPPTATTGQGGQYSPFTVTLKDAFGQTTAATVATVVTLATDSDGQFRQVGTTTQIFNVAIAVGQTYARFDYHPISAGTHTITVSSGALTPDTAAVTVIPDSVAPTTDLTVGNPKYISDSTTYVGPNTQITLQGVDNPGGSGVKETKYRMDSGGWIVYTGPFNLATFAHGSHTIGYMSTDNALNSETEKTTTVFLDKNPPSVTLVSPSGTIWVTSLSVRFEARITDEGSGLASSSLILDGTDEGALTPGTTMSLTLTVTQGTHTWTVRASDNVGNIQQPAEITVVIGLDNTAPSITGVAINPTAPTHGDAVVVSANVQDTGSGVQTVVLKYSTDNVNWNTVTMTLSSGTLYQGTIPGQNVFTNVSYYVQATDRLDNAGQSSSASYSVGIPTLWLYAGGGFVLLLVALFLIRFVLSRPSSPPPSAPPPPPSY